MFRDRSRVSLRYNRRLPTSGKYAQLIVFRDHLNLLQTYGRHSPAIGKYAQSSFAIARTFCKVMFVIYPLSVNPRNCVSRPLHTVER